MRLLGIDMEHASLGWGGIDRVSTVSIHELQVIYHFQFNPYEFGVPSEGTTFDILTVKQ